ncbi:MAG: tRNA (guanosine(37)-N1)-methyltransferase TrmD [Spirochaetia bacterium]|nr:tRNA (guanosine(37)-N1)-methyltransferase TrmD [Spirochaetota bacterium]MCX8096628.1 tRNA (guanosine(37)-N1)-methyltransferase TrmD [Spirochaetota bacterium]MDW8112075.1 tRNA (guanosine(37)-N1)-methyltransferase TrmD [Spirochaetia bacterium]
MRVIFLTIFPNIIETYFSTSMMDKATKRDLLEYTVINIRDFAKDKHKTVDDYVYGGGDGMVFKPDVVYEAISHSKTLLPSAKVIYMSSKGRNLTRNVLKEYLNVDSLIILCGRYEGVDERIIDNFVDDEIGIGDFVLTGGELPAMMFIDALVRMKGLISSSALENESFTYKGGLLEYDQYTRPREFMNLKVPDVLVNGNHKEIARWRHFSALRNTYRNRPELLKNVKLSREDIIFLLSEVNYVG